VDFTLTKSEAPEAGALMTDRFRKWINVAVMAVILASVLFSPYGSDDVPEWRLRVVDEMGQPVPEAGVVQEWTHPVVKDKVIRVYDVTDHDGWVTFPRGGVRASLMRRAVVYLLSGKVGRSSLHAVACWHDKTGDASWEDMVQKPEHRLTLHGGSCPYTSSK
jgi:hypothetical protein